MAQLTGAFKAILDDVEKYTKKRADDANRIMKGVINKDTGALADSVQTVKVGTAHYRVGINQAKLVSDPRNKGGVDYTPYYYYGSKPHTIRPKNGGVLSWIGKDGNRHYAKIVHHPGNKPHDFLGETLAKM